MKIISIMSSYRKSENTENLVRLFEKDILLIANEQKVSLEFKVQQKYWQKAII